MWKENNTASGVPGGGTEPSVSLLLSLDDRNTSPHAIAKDISNIGFLDGMIPDLAQKHTASSQIGSSDSLHTGPATFFIHGATELAPLTTDGGCYLGWRRQPRARSLVFVSVSPEFNSSPIPILSTLVFSNTAIFDKTKIRIGTDRGYKGRLTWT